MITKLLFTAAIVFAVYLLAAKGGRVRATAPADAHAIQRRRNVLRRSVYGLAVGLVLLSAVLLYMEFRPGPVVEVRVVDTRTGHATLYRARKEAVRERSFDTLDGRTVQVAETERIEVRGGR